jgi:hypothetical protein
MGNVKQKRPAEAFFAPQRWRQGGVKIVPLKHLLDLATQIPLLSISTE